MAAWDVAPASYKAMSDKRNRVHSLAVDNELSKEAEAAKVIYHSMTCGIANDIAMRPRDG
jgi:hypothetical protein